MHVLTTTFPDCKIFALGALRWRHWFLEMHDMLAQVNMYLRRKHHVSVCNISKCVCYWHLERDWIHLNKEGYELLMSKAIGSVFDSYYAMMKPKPTYELPDDWNNMSQPQRRRYIKRQKKLLAKRTNLYWWWEGLGPWRGSCYILYRYHFCTIWTCEPSDLVFQVECGWPADGIFIMHGRRSVYQHRLLDDPLRLDRQLCGNQHMFWNGHKVR